MITWKRQGGALVGAVKTSGKRTSRIVLVAGRDNPMGAMLAVVPNGQSRPEVVPLAEALELLGPQDVIEILCMQERVYGDSGLEPPEDVA